MNVAEIPMALWLLAGATIALAALTVYSACVVSGRKDDL